ncbi:MAG: diguanylate cyclase [Aureliella sp.]
MSNYVEQILSNDKIPSPSSVAVRLLDLVSKPDVNVKELAEVLGADPILSARVIDYANTPIVGAKREITSLQQAVMVMGTRMLRLLSLSFSLMETRNQADFDYDAFWKLSLGTALATRLLAEKAGGDPEAAFLNGLVLNIGQIGIGNTFPAEQNSLQPTDGSLLDISTRKEAEIFGCNRYEIGSQLLQKWNFPKYAIETVESYDPDKLTSKSTDFFVAQQLASLLLGSTHSAKRISRAKRACFKAAKIREPDFDQLFDSLIESWQRYEELFDAETLEFTCIEELQNRTKSTMVQISLDMAAEIETLRQEKEEISATAIIDALTKLKNRSAYDEEIQGTVEYHNRNRRPFGILVIDLDHFKSINDTHGHAAGDVVLTEVGATLRARTRKYDDVYRFGGEEFVAVITDCGLEGIASVATRFLEAIEALKIDFEGTAIPVTASIGVCWTPYPKAGGYDELFRVADEALYEAKHTGRNRLVLRHFEEAALELCGAS